VIQAKAGQGQVLVAGFGLPHVFDHFRHWVREWGESMGVVPKVQLNPWDLQASLRTAGDKGFLFLFNYHFTEREGSVTLPFPGTRDKTRLPRIGTLVIPPLSGTILPINIPVRPGVTLAYATAEVLDLSSNPRGVKTVVSTLPGRPVTVAFTLPKKPRSAVSGAQKPTFRWTNGQATLTLTPQAPETKITLNF
jgi:hypothetical protein